MATDIIGVLGESSQVTVGTHTVYTCPTSKAAKVKLMYRAEMVNTATLAIKVNGITVAEPAAASGAEYFYSSKSALYEEMGTPTNAPTGDADATTVAPAPHEYYLSAGDTVQYVVGVVDITAMNFQVVGAEIDVS